MATKRKQVQEVSAQPVAVPMLGKEHAPRKWAAADRVLGSMVLPGWKPLRAKPTQTLQDANTQAVEELRSGRRGAAAAGSRTRGLGSEGKEFVSLDDVMPSKRVTKTTRTPEEIEAAKKKMDAARLKSEADAQIKKGRVERLQAIHERQRQKKAAGASAASGDAMLSEPDASPADDDDEAVIEPDHQSDEATVHQGDAREASSTDPQVQSRGEESALSLDGDESSVAAVPTGIGSGGTPAAPAGSKRKRGR